MYFTSHELLVKAAFGSVELLWAQARMLLFPIDRGGVKGHPTGIWGLHSCSLSQGPCLR